MKQFFAVLVAASLLAVIPSIAQTSTNAPPSSPVPSAMQEAGRDLLAYIATNGVIHAGFGVALKGGSQGALLAQSLPFVDFSQSAIAKKTGVAIKSGPAHADLFPTGNSQSATRDQVGWVIDCDASQLPNFILIRRLHLFAYIGHDSDAALRGQVGMSRVVAGGGAGFSF